MSSEDLAAQKILRDNRITSSRIEEIEQEKIDARPMELERIATALGMPRDWFVDYESISDDELQREAESLVQALLAAARARGQGSGSTLRDALAGGPHAE